jgi:hypothetical protein
MGLASFFGERTGSDPAVDCFAITASDTAPFPATARAIYVGGAGNVTVVTANTSVVTFVAVPVGFILPVQCVRVNATGTTATNLVGLV